jgi:hypothetical protein
MRTMAISHLCMACGLDLARVRTRLDPYYALPMVLCPDCGEATVRRRHPSLGGWQTLLRLKTSLAALALQLALLAGFLSAVVAVCVLVGDSWVRGNLAVSQRDELILAALAFGALPLALGAWLTAGLGHVRRGGAWLAFTLLTLVLISLDCVGEPLARRLLDACGLSLTLGAFRWDHFMVRLAVQMTIMTMATAGIPPGMLARVGYRQWRRNRWRARRRRRRARRTSG